MLRAWRFAWLSSIRQPWRTCLGVLGVAAVGALLFDMLLLSRGLVLSFRDVLNRAGFDVRVLATDGPPFAGPRIADANSVVAAITRLPQVQAAVPLSIREVEIPSDDATRSPSRREHASEEPVVHIQFIGADAPAGSMWTVLDGRDLPVAEVGPSVLVNRNMSRRLHLSPGSTLRLRGLCGGESDALPPMTFRISGVAEFPFDDMKAETLAGHLSDLRRLCGSEQNGAVDMLFVRSNPQVGAESAAAAIRAIRPGLHVVTNEELVERFSRVEFSYFRQISFVLATVTVFFGFLLIAVLLTASVNQRLGEIAALRALGLSRSRVVTGVLAESLLMVGIGGILAIPIGAALSVWLDRILRRLPGIPIDVHFFVFEPRALVVYGWLLAVASVGAALYPMRIVARLPIAATLRREVVG